VSNARISVNDELSKMRKESVVAYFNVIGGFDKVMLNISLNCRYKLHGLGIENITFTTSRSKDKR